MTLKLIALTMGLALMSSVALAQTSTTKGSGTSAMGSSTASTTTSKHHHHSHHHSSKSSSSSATH